jgi:hypothetical protein
MSVKPPGCLAIFSTAIFLLAASASADRLFIKDGTKADGTYLGGSGASIQFRMNDESVKTYDLSSLEWIYLSSRPATQPVSPAGSNSATGSTTTNSALVPANTGSNVPQDQAQLALDFHNQKRRVVGSPALQWCDATRSLRAEVG